MKMKDFNVSLACISSVTIVHCETVCVYCVYECVCVCSFLSYVFEDLCVHSWRFLKYTGNHLHEISNFSVLCVNYVRVHIS